MIKEEKQYFSDKLYMYRLEDGTYVNEEMLKEIDKEVYRLAVTM